MDLSLQNLPDYKRHMMGAVCRDTLAAYSDLEEATA
jgi:hypothetical protein